MLLTSRCASLLLDSAHQEQVASMMLHDPEGAAANNLAITSGIHRGPEALPSVCTHLSGCTGLGCAATCGQGGGLSCHPSLSVHPSVPNPDLLRTRQRWADTGPGVREARSKGEGITYQGFTPKEDTSLARQGWWLGQGSVRPCPLKGLEGRFREKLGLAQGHSKRVEAVLN